MKQSIILAALLVLLLAGTSCTDDNKYAYPMRYLPVQLQGSQRWSILNVETGEVVVRDRFERAPSAVVDDMFYVVNADGTVDFYDVSSPDKPVNAKPFGSVASFGTNGLAPAAKRGEAIEIINRRGETVATLPRDVAQCGMFVNGRAAYQSDEGLWGYIDERGDTVVPARYSAVNEFLHSDYAVVAPQAQEGDTAATFIVIDRDGTEQFRASAADYRPVQPYFTHGVLPAVKGDTLVCLDPKGRETASPMPRHDAVDKAGYQDYTRTAAGLFIVMKNRKMGLVDGDNTTLIAPQFDRLIDLTATRYIAMTDTVCHLVDEKGKPVGNARFVHAHGGLDPMCAMRGFIDTDLAVASLLSMFDAEQCCGARAGSTLMDLNSLTDDNPADHVDQNTVAVPYGPFRVAYAFSDNLASASPDSTGATYNYNSRLRCVMIALGVAHTGVDTEPAIVAKAQALMGTRGFVLQGDGIFVSDRATAVAMGYDRGVVNLYYYMNPSYALPLPRNQRK